MPWTDAHAQLLERFAHHFPPPHDDEGLRAWTRQAAEQFKATFPAEDWGHKSASPTRPPSTDVIATRSPFIGYDVLLDAGGPGQKLTPHPSPTDLTGQQFIDVGAHDHLGGGTVDPTDPPTTNPMLAELRMIRSLLERGITLRLTAG